LLSIISLCGNPNLAELLLAAGADPNAQDKFGFDVLYTAARRGFFDCVKVD